MMELLGAPAPEPRPTQQAREPTAREVAAAIRKMERADAAWLQDVIADRLQAPAEKPGNGAHKIRRRRAAKLH